MNKYLNEAIIGNNNILATLSGKGELFRLYYPNRDMRQYIDFYKIGIKINDSNIIYLHDDVNNVYKQYYDIDTNILNTEITNTYFNLKILQTDFCMINEDVLVRKFTFINEGNIDLDVKFLLHSQLLSDQNNFVGSKIIDNGIIQYSHDFSVSTFSKDKTVYLHQLNNTKENINTGMIQDKDYIDIYVNSI